MIRRHYRRWLVMASVLVLPLLWASGAHAISMIKVREIYPGTNNDSFVELQAFGEFIYAGDTLPGKSLILFEADGTPTLRFTFTEKNDLGASDTSFLIGDTGVQEHFGVTPDIVDPLMKSIRPAAQFAGTSATPRWTAPRGAISPVRRRSRNTPGPGSEIQPLRGESLQGNRSNG